MFRATMVLTLLVPLHGHAQSGHDHQRPQPASAPAGRIPRADPVQPGQAAFAAIQEIVEILEADPATNWSKVNVDALRQHLIDMDNVTLHAEVVREPVEGGMRFFVSGNGQIKASIQRMITAHAAIMNGASAWKYAATETETGAILTVIVPPRDAAKLRALGFMGVMAMGMHHQEHHLMIARGDNPHH